MKNVFVLSSIILCLISEAPFCPILAQDGKIASNTLFFEVAGAAYWYSVNYDRMISEEVSFRIGYASLPSFSDGDSEGARVVPIMVNYLFGKGSSKLEVGGGFGTIVSSPTEYYFISIIGYRYQPRDGGVNLRIGLYPTTFGEPQLWGGLSFGVTM